MSFDVERLRARIPALHSGAVFFDGPGGTQTPHLVADAIEAYRHLGLGDVGEVRVGIAPYPNADDVDRLVTGVQELEALR